MCVGGLCLALSVLLRFLQLFGHDVVEYFDIHIAHHTQYSHQEHLYTTQSRVVSEFY